MMKIERTLKISASANYLGAGKAWALIKLDTEGEMFEAIGLAYAPDGSKADIERARMEAARFIGDADDLLIRFGMVSSWEFNVFTFKAAKKYTP